MSSLPISSAAATTAAGVVPQAHAGAAAGAAAVPVLTEADYYKRLKQIVEDLINPKKALLAAERQEIERSVSNDFSYFRTWHEFDCLPENAEVEALEADKKRLLEHEKTPGTLLKVAAVFTWVEPALFTEMATALPEQTYAAPGCIWEQLLPDSEGLTQMQYGRALAITQVANAHFPKFMLSIFSESLPADLVMLISSYRPYLPIEEANIGYATKRLKARTTSNATRLMLRATLFKKFAAEDASIAAVTSVTKTTSKSKKRKAPSATIATAAG